MPIERTIEELSALLGDRVSTAPAVLEQHGQDWTWNPGYPPEVVVYPKTTEEVSEIVKICSRQETPVIPFGAGTSVEGHFAAIHGGVCIDFVEMNQILAVHEEDLDAHCQAGVTRKQLNKHLRQSGLFFPIDPGADATLGGMTATRASGTNAVRYGTMKDAVIALTVVMADGRVVQTSRRARKSSTGYDLTRLFVGSEGTLGVITEVTVRLYGVPEATTSAVCSFPDMQSCVTTVIETIQTGVPVARIELLDEVMVDAVNKYSKLDYSVAPTLFLEFTGTEAAAEEAAQAVETLAKESGCTDFQWSADEGARERMWQGRRDVPWASMALRPGSKMLTTDVCVPISRLAECILQTKADLAQTHILATCVGHVGDGNFHLGLMIDPENAAEVEEAEAFNTRLVERALAMEGTCSGEHGIGMGKMRFMHAEHGEAVEVMRAIKQALDPKNLMNPGKLIPPADGH
jgi:D-lactate dehydrogenase (cytochrome)